ncbi:MAG: hypothetical protein IJS61_00565 [Firmicutes bacterium]|nr:hypothetical protein [Bacillota bacterium]
MNKIYSIILNIVMDILAVVFVGFLVCFALGINIYSVEDDLMEPKIAEGTACFMDSRHDYESAKTGDIMGYTSADGTKKVRLVVGKEYDGYKVKASALSSPEPENISKEMYGGVMVFKLPLVGKLSRFLSSTAGLISMGIILAVTVIVNVVRKKQ